ITLGRGPAEEAAAARALRHAAIVPLLDAGADCDPETSIARGFQSRERIDGRTLASLLEVEHQLTIERTVALALALLPALAYAHREGVVHRGLRPASIWLGPDGAPLLVDFGLAPREG